MPDKMQPDKGKDLSIEKDSQINVVVNRTSESDIVDIMGVFRSMKYSGHIYTWVILLCIIIGICVPLLIYQFKTTDDQIASVVTLDYDVFDNSDDSLLTPTPKPVSDLTAPDGEELDLSQITSAYVLQNALNGLVLSESISITQLRDNVKVERILTEDSRRQQELASKMLEDKDGGAYAQL